MNPIRIPHIITAFLFIASISPVLSQEQLSTFIKARDGNSSLGQIALFKNELYFMGSSAEHGTELWRTDGTEAGTKLIKDIAPGPTSALFSDPTSFIVMGDYLYFWARDGSSGQQIWRTDGTSENTIRITDHPGKSKSALIGTHDQLFYFTSRYDNTDADDYTIHLWASDGSPFSEWLIEK